MKIFKAVCEVDKTIDTKWVTKVGDHKYVNALYENGELYCQTVSFFRKRDANQERFDGYENASYIDQVINLKVQDPISGKIITLSTEAGAELHLSRASYLEHDNLVTGNIFSCSGFTEENEQELDNLNPKFREFGNTIMLITNPNEFFSRIERELTKLNLRYKLSPVSYYNSFETISQLSIFQKKHELSYQNEIRLWIDYPKDEPLILKTGSLKDISSLFLVEEILKLQSTNK